MTSKSIKYEILTREKDKSGIWRDRWETATRAVTIKWGALHYQLRDGTNGICGKGKWRVKDAGIQER